MILVAIGERGKSLDVPFKTRRNGLTYRQVSESHCQGRMLKATPFAGLSLSLYQFLAD